MSKRKVLLLEDDPNLGSILQEQLQLQGFEVVLCVDGEQGAQTYHRDKFDLCLVDVMMPKKDGFTFAREVRQVDDEIPLIFLTAKSLNEDKIEGFRIGCDDYLTKPFSLEELLLRINAVLKRSQSRAADHQGQTQFVLGSFTFDYPTRLLCYAEREVNLTAKEADLLRLLCLHLNRTLKREVALQEVWGDTGYFSGRSMDVFISKLRKHLKDDERIHIMSIHGQGFKLIISE